MSTLGLNSRVRAPTTSDWDDVQRRLGNLPPLPQADDLANAANAAGAAAEAADADANDAPGSAACTHRASPQHHADDAHGAHGDDADELAALRAERRRTLQRGRFGSLVAIGREAFVDEVNHANEGVGVVVFLEKRGHYPSSYMRVLLERLADKFRDVKFVAIPHDDCIPGYPDANLPTLLLYRDDDLLGQRVGTAPYGGKDYGIDDVEWELSVAGILSSELPRNPHERPHR